MNVDRTAVVVDEQLGAIVGEWRDGELVATGADRSVLYPVKNMPVCTHLAVYVAASHLSLETRMQAVEWLVQHACAVPARWLAELHAWHMDRGPAE